MDVMKIELCTHEYVSFELEIGGEQKEYDYRSRTNKLVLTTS